MDLLKKKQYGLVLKGADAQFTAPKKIAAVFGDSDDEDTVDVLGKNRSASSLRAIKEAERAIQRAEAEDPTIMDYDGAYDEIEAKRNEKTAEMKAKDKERKSKYAEDIKKAFARRELEKQSRDERKQLKEREQEGAEFADKEVFVTGAYRKQMEEVQKFREEEDYEARFNAATNVENQEMWQAGFSRTLLSTLARDGDHTATKTVKKEEPEPEEAPTTEKFPEKKSSKLKNMRSRKMSRSPSPEEQSKQKGGKKKEKSIYDSDQSEGEAPPTRSMGLTIQKKNFEGELKPGLNKVVKRAPAEGKGLTKAERLQRQFTPTSSDDEREREKERDEKRRTDRSRRDSREKEDRDVHRHDKDNRKEREHKEEKKTEEKKKTVLEDPEAVKAKRLLRLKEILKQRNGPKEIAEFRERYMERRESGMVQMPF